MDNKNRINFLNVVTAKGKENTFNFAVTSGVVSRIEAKEAAGKRLVTAVLPVSGRSKYINKLFGTSFGDNDTVWVNLNIWEDKAERFEKMLFAMNKPEKLVLTVTGSLSMSEREKDGKKYQNVNLSVFDWKVDKILGDTANAPQETSQGNSPEPTNQAESDMFDDNGMLKSDEFDDLSGVADDLPF